MRRGVWRALRRQGSSIILSLKSGKTNNKSLPASFNKKQTQKPQRKPFLSVFPFSGPEPPLGQDKGLCRWTGSKGRHAPSALRPPSSLPAGPPGRGLRLTQLREEVRLSGGDEALSGLLSFQLWPRERPAGRQGRVCAFHVALMGPCVLQFTAQAQADRAGTVPRTVLQRHRRHLALPCSWPEGEISQQQKPAV